MNVKNILLIVLLSCTTVSQSADDLFNRKSILEKALDKLEIAAESVYSQLKEMASQVSASVTGTATEVTGKAKDKLNKVYVGLQAKLTENDPRNEDAFELVEGALPKEGSEQFEKNKKLIHEVKRFLLGCDNHINKVDLVVAQLKQYKKQLKELKKLNAVQEAARSELLNCINSNLNKMLKPPF